MVRSLLFVAFVAVLAGGCLNISNRTQRIAEAPPTPAYVQTAEARAPVRMLRHVVLFQFKEGTSAEDIRRVENAFSALPSKIDAIYDFEWGTDVSVENLHRGFTHCFLVTFRSEAGRAEYLPHPAHKEFVELIGPYLAEALVVDYWAK